MAQAAAMASPGATVRVRYNGASGNHYIVSPSRKVRHYGYGKKGTILPAVWVEDVLRRPEYFIPVSIEEAKKAWPAYPADAPLWLVEELGDLPVGPPKTTPEDELYDQAEAGDDEAVEKIKEQKEIDLSSVIAEVEQKVKDGLIEEDTVTIDLSDGAALEAKIEEETVLVDDEPEEKPKKRGRPKKSEVSDGE